MYCYRPKRSFGQGNIFTPVCHSVHRGVVPDQACPPGTRQVHPSGTRQVHPPDQAGTPRPGTPPPRTRHPPRQVHNPPRTRQVHPPDQAGTPPPRSSRLRNTVNDRMVRILLECILVNYSACVKSETWANFCVCICSKQGKQLRNPEEHKQIRKLPLPGSPSAEICRKWPRYAVDY